MSCNKTIMEQAAKERKKLDIERAEREKMVRAEVALYDFMAAKPAHSEAVTRMVQRESLRAGMYGFREGLKFRDEQAAEAKGMRR